MSETSNMHRRTFLAAQAGLLCLASPAVAFSATPKWETANYAQFKHRIGKTFIAWSEDGRQFQLKLAQVDRVRLGRGRPADLPRRIGLTLIFDSPGADEIAAESGGAMLTIQNRRFGTSKMYFETERMASGKHRFELHFN